jgi:hypothetical protein
MKKIRMFAAVFALISVAGLCYLHERGLGAQWSMQNNTKITLDFYIDDIYQCQALSHGFCTAQVEAGKHILKAKSRDGKFIKTSEKMEIKEGESRTWVVEQEP